MEKISIFAENRFEKQSTRSENGCQPLSAGLNAEEKTEVVAKCGHLAILKFSPTHPYAFTEHGAIMLAAVLNTPRAIEVSVFVVRAFIRLREILTTHNKFDGSDVGTTAQFAKSESFFCQPILKVLK